MVRARVSEGACRASGRAHAYLVLLLGPRLALFLFAFRIRRLAKLGRLESPAARKVAVLVLGRRIRCGGDARDERVRVRHVRCQRRAILGQRDCVLEAVGNRAVLHQALAQVAFQDLALLEGPDERRRLAVAGLVRPRSRARRPRVLGQMRQPGPVGFNLLLGRGTLALELHGQSEATRLADRRARQRGGPGFAWQRTGG